jgi:hypothetical protein
MPDTKLEDRDDYKAGHAAGRDDGFKAATDRMNTVFASEHFPGREAAAAKLLGKDMSAADIVDILADMPKVEPKADQEAANKAAEDAARAEMREEMKKSGNADLGNSADADTSSRAKADSVWDRARTANEKKGN